MDHAADSHDLIRVQGARENNLRDVSVDIPKRRLTVFTGVSGSGKSSLVFATIAAESSMYETVAIACFSLIASLKGVGEGHWGVSDTAGFMIQLPRVLLLPMLVAISFYTGCYRTCG